MGAIAVKFPGDDSFDHWTKLLSDLSNSFLKIHKQSFSYTHKHILFVGTSHCYTGMFPEKEGGIRVLESLAPSNQTTRSLERTCGQQSWLEK
jgi:hypothetical protein